MLQYLSASNKELGVVEFLRPSRKKASKGKERRSTMLKMTTRVRKINSKATTLHPFHPKLPTSISTLHFLPKTWAPKLPNQKLTENFPKKIINESKNNYLHTATPKWDVPKATKHQAYSSKTVDTSITTLP